MLSFGSSGGCIMDRLLFLAHGACRVVVGWLCGWLESSEGGGLIHHFEGFWRLV